MIGNGRFLFAVTAFLPYAGALRLLRVYAFFESMKFFVKPSSTDFSIASFSSLRAPVSRIAFMTAMP